MKFDSARGLYVPEQSPEPLRLFLDETHLAGRTATVQAGVLVPNDWYVRDGRKESANLLRKLNLRAQEFKASNLSKGNVGVYEEFLRLFVGAVASVTGTGQASSIVTVDGPLFQPAEYIADIASRLDASFAEYGAMVDPRFLSEFSRQLAWFGHHGRFLFKMPLRNGLTITFDNKYSYASLLEDRVGLRKAGSPAVLTPVKEILRIYLSTPGMLRLLRVGKADGFEIRRSEDEFGLQAADLFANLFYASLKYTAGVRNAATELRVELLRKFISNVTPDSMLSSALRISGNDVECVRPDLCSRCEIY